MLGKIVVEGDRGETFPFYNPNIMNLVAEVSTKVMFELTGKEKEKDRDATDEGYVG